MFNVTQLLDSVFGRTYSVEEVGGAVKFNL